MHKAASLAKTDLTTELVKEFTELQGIVGGLYASVQELDPDMPDATRQAIAQAIYDHYKPESMEDSVPRSVEGAVSRSPIKPTASPECLPLACSQRDRKIRLRCDDRPTGS